MSSSQNKREKLYYIFVTNEMYSCNKTDSLSEMDCKVFMEVYLPCVAFFLLHFFFKGEISNYIYIVLWIIQIQSFVLTGKPQSYKYFSPVRITFFFFYFPFYLLLIK